MKNFLCSKEFRQISLINYLNTNESWYHIFDLSKMIKVSARTLLNYFKEIEVLFESKIRFEFNNNLVRAKISSDIGILAVQRTYLRQTFPYDLIEHSFYFNKSEIDFVSSKMFTSSSTIYRNVKRINLAIEKKYKIRMNYIPLYFVGKECQIQKFYTDFFNELTEPLSWPFKNIDEKAVTSLLNQTCQILGVNLSISKFRYFKIAIAVAATRLYQGNFIDVDRIDERIISVTDDIIELSEMNYFYEFCQYDIKKMNKGCFVAQLFGHSFCNSYMYIQDTLCLENDRVENEEAYQKFMDILLYLSNKYDIPLNPKQVNHLFKTFTYHINEFGYKEVFLSYSCNYISRLRDINPVLLNDFEYLLDEYCEKYYNDIQVCSCFLIYNLCLEWKGLLKATIVNRKKCKGLIVNFYDYRLANNIREYLMVFFKENLEIDIYNKNELDIDELSNSHYEFIISDFSLPRIEGKYIINIETLPTRADIQYISECIINIIETQMS